MGAWAVILPALLLVCGCGRAEEITLGEYALANGGGGVGGLGSFAGQDAGGSTQAGSGGSADAGGSGSSGTPASAGTPGGGDAGLGGAPAVNPDGGDAGAGYYCPCSSGFCPVDCLECADLLECDGVAQSGFDPGTVCRRKYVDCSIEDARVSCERLANEECGGVVPNMYIDPNPI